jgi:DNA topoisomerase I
VADAEDLQRIRALAIPPAWTDVWICPWPNGHIQALGTDAAGRRQYRYHEAWRARRDREKFERVEEFGRALPKLRARVTRDLKRADLSRDRVLAAIVRLLDIGCFRVGGEEYAEEHDTFGVASLHKKHVRSADGSLYFDYPAKDSIERKVCVDDADAYEVVKALRSRRSGGPALFAYKEGRRWVDVDASDVNDYIKEAAGQEFTSKDFRTWTATVLAATALAGTGEADSNAARRRAVTAAVSSVADQLGNTPAVCRSSYVDPRIIDRFESGETISDLLPKVPQLPEPGEAVTPRAVKRRRTVEHAVIDLLEAS